MASYTPALLASLKHDVEETDIPLPAVGKKHGISKRTLLRLSDREGWKKRSERLRDLPPAARLLSEATALLTERGATQQAGLNRHPEVPAAGGPRRATAQTGPSSFEARDLRSLAPQDDGDRFADEMNAPTTAIARIERLVEKELDAEEAVRAQLGPLPRNPADAERTARTLSTLTQTLHALQRLRSGLGFQSHDDDDDIPRDIDEFRRELARRIDAFVASRTQRADAGGDSRPRVVDAVR